MVVYGYNEEKTERISFMISNEIYQAAYKFKDSKLWTKMLETELFAVKLDDTGLIGYCTIMGTNDQHRALAVYVGPEGFTTLRQLQDADEYSYADLFCQDCIQCSIETRKDMEPEELAGLKKYCTATHTSFRSPYPKFSRFHKNCAPWLITDPQDWDYLLKALHVVSLMTDEIAKGNRFGLREITFDVDGEAYADEIPPYDFFVELFPDENVTIPLFSVVDGKLAVERISLPPYTEYKTEPPTQFNDVLLAKLRRLRRSGTLQCEIIRSPALVEESPGYLPAILLAVRGLDGFMLHPVVGENAVYDPNKMLNEFISTLVDLSEYPSEIRIRTDETRTLLEEFCRRAKIQLIEDEDLDELDEAIESLIERFDPPDDESIMEMLNTLSTMDPKALAQIPDFLVKVLQEADEAGALPEKIAEKLRELGMI